MLLGNALPLHRCQKKGEKRQEERQCESTVPIIHAFRDLSQQVAP